MERLSLDSRVWHPGKSFSFDLFYGVALDMESSYSALSSVGASLGVYGYSRLRDTNIQCSASVHYEAFHNQDDPAVFILGFRLNEDVGKVSKVE